ncbi:MAG TPA: hypothetical protein VH478_24690 [Trebonia sp.]|nr:hypothetical protein [Trebonia sp.]
MEPGKRHGPWRAACLLAVAATGLSSLTLATAAAAAAAIPVAAKAKASAIAAPALPAAQQQRLMRLYASKRAIPVADIARGVPATLQVTRAAGGQEWALAGFLPASGVPLSVSISFQDGASLAVYTRSAGRDWALRELGRADLACDASIPAAVVRAWGYSACRPAAPAVAPAPAAPGARAVPAAPRAAATPASVSGSAIAAIARQYIGVIDNPPEAVPSSNAADCNPFTAIEAPSASAAGCGVDPTFGIQDRTEFWCADFGKYAWSQAGVSGSGSLTPAAASFYDYGLNQGESLPANPSASGAAAGDAIVMWRPGGTPSSYADHVGIVAAVNASAGTISVVNGDVPWGGQSVGVSESGYWTPASLAAELEGSGEDWAFVAPAGLNALANTYQAQMEDNDSFLYGYNYGTDLKTTLGMQAGTSPSITGLSDQSTYETAFQSNQHFLYMHSSAGANINTQLGMDTASSPAVAALGSGDGWEAAFQSNQHKLYLRSSAGVNDNIQLGMDPGTSPAIAGSGGGWIAVFQDNDNLLYVTTSAGLKYQTTLGMEPGTSPSVTATPSGGFVVAFASNTGKLYTLQVHGTGASAIAGGTKTQTGYGMEAGTSPSIASYVDNTWRVAFETNDHYLYTYLSSGTDATSQMGMNTGSSPSITCLPDGTYEVAFEANNNTMDIYHTGSTNAATLLGMMNATSPSISSPYLY